MKDCNWFQVDLPCKIFLIFMIWVVIIGVWMNKEMNYMLVFVYLAEWLLGMWLFSIIDVNIDSFVLWIYFEDFMCFFYLSVWNIFLVSYKLLFLVYRQVIDMWKEIKEFPCMKVFKLDMLYEWTWWLLKLQIW